MTYIRLPSSENVAQTLSRKEPFTNDILIKKNENLGQFKLPGNCKNKLMQTAVKTLTFISQTTLFRNKS